MAYALTVAFLLGFAFPLLTSAVFARFEGRPLTFNEGLLFVLETVTTTGYGEQAPFASLVTTLWSGVVMAAGFVILTVWLAGLAGTWVSRHLELLPPRRAPRGLRGHIIICGVGPVGQVLARQCEARKAPYLLLDPDRAQLATLLASGLKVLEGNPGREGALREAGIGRCRALVTTLADPENAVVCLLARALRPGVPVSCTVSTEERESLLRAAGASRVVPARPTVGLHLAEQAIGAAAAGPPAPKPRSALVLGYGEAGSTAAEALRQAGIAVRVLTLEAPPHPDSWVQGDATRPDDLLLAGVQSVNCCLVTLQDDAAAVFATLAVRQLNPGATLFCRAAHADTVPNLYLAGADMVLSVADVVGAELLEQLSPH